MSDEHHHEDCVQCLQKYVRMLQVRNDEACAHIKEAEAENSRLLAELKNAQRACSADLGGIDFERANVIAYLEQLEAAQTENTKEQDGARFAIRTALAYIHEGKHHPF